MKKLLLTAFLTLLIAAPAFAVTASKDGTPIDLNPGTPGEPGNTRAFFEYNTGGTIDYVPTLGGSSDGWAEYGITNITNDTGVDLCVVELSWPCGGPESGIYGWLVWTGTGGTIPGAPETADYFGPYTPVDPNPDTFPPTTYTYVDVSAENIPFVANDIIFFGFDNTGMMGQTEYNGVETWGWYGGVWDSDAGWSRTTILQIKADACGGVPTEDVSWGRVKTLY